MPAPLPLGLTDGRPRRRHGRAGPRLAGRGIPPRKRFSPDLAAAALHQAALRRQAAVKFGAEAAQLFFTRAGLEQATRPVVAAHHARRFLAAGASRVVDLGCGIGADALAFVRAGLEVVAVERDPEMAAVAAANLGDLATVVCADAEQVVGHLLTPGVAVFCDPARRDTHGRLWQVEDFSPSWGLVLDLLDGRRTAGVKLGPGTAARPHPTDGGGRVAERSRRRGRGRALGRTRRGGGRTRCAGPDRPLGWLATAGDRARPAAGGS